MRTGIGVDVHPIDKTKPCFLGGIEIPHESGCAGHSDGDVIAHALCDAILSAAGIGDLGTVFGTEQPEWQGASGVQLLEEVLRRITCQGWGIVNAVVQFIGNSPKINPLRLEMQRVLSQTCQADITIIATTTDGLGLTGRGEGRAAIATTLLNQSSVQTN